MNETSDENTLQPGETHPMAYVALGFIMSKLENPLFQSRREALASCAMSNNRIAKICLETLRRIENKEAVSDRYLLGLAWFLRSFGE